MALKSKLTTKQSPTQDKALHQTTTSVNQTTHITHTHARTTRRGGREPHGAPAGAAAVAAGHRVTTGRDVTEEGRGLTQA